jgi:hypothetical protein
MDTDGWFGGVSASNAEIPPITITTTIIIALTSAFSRLIRGKRAFLSRS